VPRAMPNGKAHVSEAGTFLKADRLLYHSSRGSRASFRTCIESNKKEVPGLLEDPLEGGLHPASSLPAPFDPGPYGRQPVGA
jgi:hypothetical protein